MVSNVRYNLMRTALELAERNLHSLSLLIVSPSNQGKTDTVDIFSKEFDGVWVVQAQSESRMADEFERRRNITMIIVDEPYDWEAQNYKSVAMMCKHILSGKVGAPRSTVYVTGITSKKKTKTAIVLMCNKKQYDTVRRSLAGCGLLERTVTIMTQHSSFETLDYINEFYDTHDDIQFENEYLFCTREITKDEKRFIDKYFTGYPRESVMWIAKTTPPEIFEELKPFLTSEANARFEEEQILFKEVKK